MAQDGADLPRNYRLKALLLVEFYLRMSRLMPNSLSCGMGASWA